MKEVVLRISGKVQGVFFRAETKRKADELGVCGWVRNEPDGSIRTCAQGEKKALKEFTAWCRSGPPAARVEKIEEAWREPAELFEEFTISY